MAGFYLILLNLSFIAAFFGTGLLLVLLFIAFICALIRRSSNNNIVNKLWNISIKLCRVCIYADAVSFAVIVLFILFRLFAGQ